MKMNTRWFIVDTAIFEVWFTDEWHVAKEYAGSPEYVVIEVDGTYNAQLGVDEEDLPRWYEIKEV